MVLLNKNIKKIIRTLFLSLPRVYDFVYDAKHRYFLNFVLKKVHEEDFKAFKLICKQDFQLFLDVGANAGQSALSIFTVKPNAKIVSFEPNPSNYAYLEKIANKFKNFEYKKFGLGNKNKIMNLYLPVYNRRKMTPWASFKYEKAIDWISGSVYFFDKKKFSVETIPLEIKTLDSLNLDPDFIKIDVQGFEHEVLLGAKETITRCKPVFLIESVKQNGEVYSLLKELGYSIYKYKNGKFLLNSFNSINSFLFPE